MAGEEPNKLDIVEQLDYKQDKSLFCARIICKNANKVLKRKDSSGLYSRTASSSEETTPLASE